MKSEQWPLYCARLAVSHLRHAGVQIPDGLLQHLADLTGSSTSGTQSVAAQPNSTHDLIGAQEAAAILNCTSRYIRRIHADLDGQLISGRWMFNRHTVTNYAQAKAERHDLAS